MLKLNSRDKITARSSVLRFMEINYFVALICEVKLLLCGIAGSCSLLLVSDNFSCSLHLSEDFGENVTHHLTIQCTVSKFQEK